MCSHWLNCRSFHSCSVHISSFARLLIHALHAFTLAHLQGLLLYNPVHTSLCVIWENSLVPHCGICQVAFVISAINTLYLIHVKTHWVLLCNSLLGIKSFFFLSLYFLLYFIYVVYFTFIFFSFSYV